MHEKVMKKKFVPTVEKRGATSNKGLLSEKVKNMAWNMRGDGEAVSLILENFFRLSSGAGAFSLIIGFSWNSAFNFHPSRVGKHTKLRYLHRKAAARNRVTNKAWTDCHPSSFRFASVDRFITPYQAA